MDQVGIPQQQQTAPMAPPSQKKISIFGFVILILIIPVQIGIIYLIKPIFNVPQIGWMIDYEVFLITIILPFAGDIILLIHLIKNNLIKYWWILWIVGYILSLVPVITLILLIIGLETAGIGP